MPPIFLKQENVSLVTTRIISMHINRELLERAETLMRDATKSDNIELRETAWQALSALLIQQDRYKDALNTLEQIHKPLSAPDAMRVSVYYAMNDLKKFIDILKELEQLPE